MRAVIALATTAALLLLAAWQIPPHLDWNRYRGAIASFASARMGRPVTIAGQVHLLLLPEAVLVAERVTLADRGDGVSAQIGALRLRIALGPLLRGRLVPRRLELDDPAVTLPWPLPRNAATAVPARVAGGFTAKIEGGSLRLGGLALNGITGGVQTDPDTGAFAADGAMRLAGLPWRFTALIGAPGRDGISTLTIALDGQQAALGAGGTLRGRVLAGGNVQGVLALRGDNLSHLIAAPALPWRLRGQVQATISAVSAAMLDLELGASPGHASAMLTLGDTPALTATAHLGQVPLEGWAAALPATRTHLPAHLSLSADAGTLPGGALRNLTADLTLSDAPPIIAVAAIAPGNTQIRFKSAPATAPDQLAGPIALRTGDAATLLTWLRPLAPAILAMPALADIASADLNGTLALAPDHLALTNLAGSVNGASVTGMAALATGARQTMTATLKLSRLALPLPGAAPTWQQTAAAWQTTLARAFAEFDATLDITASTARLGTAPLTNLTLQAQGGAGGLALHRLAADASGAHLELSGALARDGSLTDGHVDITAPEATAIRLPPTWPTPPAGLWHGPLHLGIFAAGPPHAIAAGPPQAITAQLRADLDDLRAEAEARIDTHAPAATATITIRHPGAPRLLVELGLLAGQGPSHRADWLGQGSVAVLAHLTAIPTQLTLQDFTIAAGALRLAGHGNADLTAAEPALTGEITAENLALPALPTGATLLPLGLLTGWHGQLHVAADQIEAGFTAMANHATADLTVSAGAAQASVHADIAGGRLAGDLAIDTTGAAPNWALRGVLLGAALDQLPTLPAPDLHGGTADIGADLTAAGSSPAALLATLSGEVHGALHATAINGIDLARISKLGASHAPHQRAALAAALTTGDTGPLSGAFDGTFASGTAKLENTALNAPAGAVSVAGSWDLPAATQDLRVQIVQPAVNAPALSVHWSGGHRSVETGGSAPARQKSIISKQR